ncbi:unnamed protein product [Adineta steineri]|uniref:Uncharacterized protein n=1 Tax=Adineta steineri TaxID=433720 RepID=A0A819GBY3_9BILA|nr:unnamed protein product [Adineta steineri]
MNRLHLLRHDEIIRAFSNGVVSREIPEIPRFPEIGTRLYMNNHQHKNNNHSMKRNIKADSRTKSSVERPTSPIPVLQVATVVFEKNRVTIDMKIKQTESDSNPENDTNDKDDDIVYPIGVKDHRPYKIVAQYRRMLGKSTDFIAEPLCIGENETETAVLGLSSFAEKHGCDLMFTDEDHRFDNSMYRAACGTADLGIIHLLATDAVQTATFCFVMDFDFNNEFQQSTEKVEAFVMDFCQAIAKVISCDTNNVRIFSISKMEKEKQKSEVKFGVTSLETEKTEQLAEILKIHARSGFSDDKILARVLARDYDYTWKPALQTLKLQASDLAPEFNFDYRPDSTPNQLERGSHPYYLPRGWYRHALRVLHKYEKDPKWLEHSNTQGEWPVVYHGTKSWAVSSITQQGLMTNAVKVDLMRPEAIQQMGVEADRPGLYVATHCEGGAVLYSEPFTVSPLPNKTESFRIVFQCRVKPEKFTVHKSPVDEGHAWRYVDANSIRPYGILLKKED